MDATRASWIYLTVLVSILGGCTAAQTPDSIDALDEVHSTSQAVSTTTTIKDSALTTVTMTLPVIGEPLDQKPKSGQVQEISTTTSVRDGRPTETILDLAEKVPFDSETRPEITFTSKLPRSGFSGVMYAYINNSEPIIDLQFLDAETNVVSKTRITGSYALDCWTYFGADPNEWTLLYDDYGPAPDVLHGYLIQGHWGEVPTALRISFQEHDMLVRQSFQTRSQFDSSQLSFVLTNYLNGFSLNVNGVVREYHVQPWNASQYVLQNGDVIPSKEAIPSNSEPDTGLLSGFDPYGGFGASLHGTDGELFAISIKSIEPACGSRFVYFVSMVTGEIVHCTWTSAKFLLVAPPDQTTILDEIRLPPSGWFSNEPCTNDETDLADLAAVLETRGRQPDN